MGKGGYSGGSTTVGPGSGWFSSSDPHTERVYAVGKAEGEAAINRIKEKKLAECEKLLASNTKISKSKMAQEMRARSTKDKLIADGSADRLPEPGTKAALYRDQLEAKLGKVEIVRKVKKTIKPLK